MDLPKILYKNYNLPKISALVHATLLTILFSATVIWVYNILSPGGLWNPAYPKLEIISFYRYILVDKTFLLMIFGLVIGLNWLTGYLFFRLRKTNAAYLMSITVLVLQTAVIGSGFTLL